MDRSLTVTRRLSAVAAFLLCCALDVGASIVSEAPRPVIVEGRVVGLDDLVATAAAAYIVNVEEIVPHPGSRPERVCTWFCFQKHVVGCCGTKGARRLDSTWTRKEAWT